MGFAHLERAHVLGQASTFLHVRTHLRMLSWAIRHRHLKEVVGQILRVVGAAGLEVTVHAVAALGIGALLGALAVVGWARWTQRRRDAAASVSA